MKNSFEKSTLVLNMFELVLNLVTVRTAGFSIKKEKKDDWMEEKLIEFVIRIKVATRP